MKSHELQLFTQGAQGPKNVPTNIFPKKLIGSVRIFECITIKQKMIGFAGQRCHQEELWCENSDV